MIHKRSIALNKRSNPSLKLSETLIQVKSCLEFRMNKLKMTGLLRTKEKNCHYIVN